MPKETRKKKKQSKAKKTAPITNMEDPMAEIAARAEGGKVAVVERGSKKAKVVSLKGNGGKDEEAAAPVAARQPIEISEDAAESIRTALSALQNADIQHGRMRQQYLAREKQMMEERENLDRELTALIKSAGRRFEVPEHYVFDLDKMCFVVQPPRGMMGPMRTS